MPKKFDDGGKVTDEVDIDTGETPSYAKGGQVGGVRGFGLDNRSKPAFAAGGPKTNHKFNFKKGAT